MRLHYLALQDDPPLHNIQIPFQQETVLGHDCAIRFVVGVNGSGKSRLLRALAQLFLALERNPEKLPFPVTMVYSLQTHLGNEQPRLIYLQYPPLEKEEENKDEKDDDGDEKNVTWRAYEWPDNGVPERVGDWADYIQSLSRIKIKAATSRGGRNFFLPQTILAYTSGLTADWHTLFAPYRDPQSVEGGEERMEEERPLGWTRQDEETYGLQQDRIVEQHAMSLEDSGVTALQARAIASSSFEETESASNLYTIEEKASDIGYFVAPAMLPLAVCAVVLHHQAQKEPNASFAGLLREVGWQTAVTLTLILDPSKGYGVQQNAWERFPEEFAKIAALTVDAPEPSQQVRYVFDLPALASDGEGITLARWINTFQEGAEDVTAFHLFSYLYQWQQAGYLADMKLSLKKEGVDDLLLFDWLSDGEQLFLGRVALFHLLAHEQDALLLLDEPETHFNDIWKRRIVDMLDDSLKDQHHEVVIATHASVALTDVFKSEITILQDGSAYQSPINTFGSSPSEIMIYLFNAPNSMGQRATHYLNEQLQKDWQPEELADLDKWLDKLPTGYHLAMLQMIKDRLDAS